MEVHVGNDRRASRAWRMTPAARSSPDAEEHQRRKAQISSSHCSVHAERCEFESEAPMYKLLCRNCDRRLSERGLKMDLVNDPDNILYSTDSRPDGIIDLMAEHAQGPCNCKVRDFECGCGLKLGYHLFSSCNNCLSQNTDPDHRWFLSKEVVVVDIARGSRGEQLFWPPRNSFAIENDENLMPNVGMPPPLPKFGEQAHGDAYIFASPSPLSEWNGQQRGECKKTEAIGVSRGDILAQREELAALKEEQLNRREAELGRQGENGTPEGPKAEQATEPAAEQATEAPFADDASLAQKLESSELRVDSLKAQMRVLEAEAAAARAEAHAARVALESGASSDSISQARLDCAERLAQKRLELSKWQQSLELESTALEAEKARGKQAGAASHASTFSGSPASMCSAAGAGPQPQKTTSTSSGPMSMDGAPAAVAAAAAAATEATISMVSVAGTGGVAAARKAAALATPALGALQGASSAALSFACNNIFCRQSEEAQARVRAQAEAAAATLRRQQQYYASASPVRTDGAGVPPMMRHSPQPTWALHSPGPATWHPGWGSPAPVYVPIEREGFMGWARRISGCGARRYATPATPVVYTQTWSPY